MQRLFNWLVAIVIVCLPILYTAHLIGNYIGIRRGLEQKSAIVDHPIAESMLARLCECAVHRGSILAEGVSGSRVPGSGNNAAQEFRRSGVERAWNLSPASLISTRMVGSACG